MNTLAAATALYGYLVPPALMLLSATLVMRSASHDIARAFRDHRTKLAASAST